MKRIAGLILTIAALALPLMRLSAQTENKESEAKSKATEHPREGGDKKGAGAKAQDIHYHKTETKNYTVETPEGWEVGKETPFGQREILPAKETAVVRGASLSSMTGPGLGRQSWQQLYDTSLFFITRYAPNGEKMKATPFKLGKSKQEFECCSWTMTDADGLPLQRHVILKHTNGNILALSVKIPPAAAKESKERLEMIFQHMVDTAVVR